MKIRMMLVLLGFVSNLQGFNKGDLAFLQGNNDLGMTGKCPNCDLEGANLERFSFHDKASGDTGNLYNANLQGANLRNADLSGVNINGADFSGADVSYATWVDGSVFGKKTCAPKSIGECK